MTVEEFEVEHWPEIEKELSVAIDNNSGPPGGPAGGGSVGVDSQIAVIVTEIIIVEKLGKTPPAENIIREGGYADREDCLESIKSKLGALCWKDKEHKENANSKNTT